MPLRLRPLLFLLLGDKPKAYRKLRKLLVDYIVRNHEYHNEKDKLVDLDYEEDGEESDDKDPDDPPMAPVPSYLDAQKVEKLIDFVKESPQAVDRLLEFMKSTGADLDQDLSIEQLRNVNQLIFRGFGDLWLLSSFSYRVSVK